MWDLLPDRGKRWLQGHWEVGGQGRVGSLPDRFLVQREWCILLSHDSLLPHVRLGIWASPQSRAMLRAGLAAGLGWYLGPPPCPSGSRASWEARFLCPGDMVGQASSYPGD